MKSEFHTEKARLIDIHFLAKLNLTLPTRVDFIIILMK